MTNSTESILPDTSVFKDPVLRNILPELMSESRFAERWDGLSGAPRQAHLTILQSYMTNGAPPPASQFSAEVLAELARRDLVHVRNGEIALAYPFSTSPTDFLVRLGYVTVYAVCAVDALGTPAMVRKPAEIVCNCPTCGARVCLNVSSDGLTVENASTSDPRVWAGVVAVESCAADSQCKSMLLFCSPEHLDTWKRSQPQSARGFDLSLAQGVQLGAAVFRPFLHAQTSTAAS